MNDYVFDIQKKKKATGSNSSKRHQLFEATLKIGEVYFGRDKSLSLLQVGAKPTPHRSVRFASSPNNDE